MRISHSLSSSVSSLDSPVVESVPSGLVKRLSQQLFHLSYVPQAPSFVRKSDGNVFDSIKKYEILNSKSNLFCTAKYSAAQPSGATQISPMVSSTRQKLISSLDAVPILPSSVMEELEAKLASNSPRNNVRKLLRRFENGSNSDLNNYDSNVSSNNRFTDSNENDKIDTKYCDISEPVSNSFVVFDSKNMILNCTTSSTSIEENRVGNSAVSTPDSKSSRASYLRSNRHSPPSRDQLSQQTSPDLMLPPPMRTQNQSQFQDLDEPLYPLEIPPKNSGITKSVESCINLIENSFQTEDQLSFDSSEGSVADEEVLTRCQSSSEIVDKENNGVIANGSDQLYECIDSIPKSDVVCITNEVYNNETDCYIAHGIEENLDEPEDSTVLPLDENRFDNRQKASSDSALDEGVDTLNETPADSKSFLLDRKNQGSSMSSEDSFCEPHSTESTVFTECSNPILRNYTSETCVTPLPEINGKSASELVIRDSLLPVRAEMSILSRPLPDINDNLHSEEVKPPLKGTASSSCPGRRQSSVSYESAIYETMEPISEETGEVSNGNDEKSDKSTLTTTTTTRARVKSVSFCECDIINELSSEEGSIKSTNSKKKRFTSPLHLDFFKRKGKSIFGRGKNKSTPSDWSHSDHNYCTCSEPEPMFVRVPKTAPSRTAAFKWKRTESPMSEHTYMAMEGPLQSPHTPEPPEAHLVHEKLNQLLNSRPEEFL